MASAVAAVMSGASLAAGSMKTGGLTSQPIGHYDFCRIYREECERQPRAVRPLHLDSGSWNAILNINATVNMVIEPKSDFDIYGKEEVWTYPESAGDCEDYVLLKRQLLVNEGIPSANLLITVVRKPDGEGHAVLTVRTDRGDYVLDNLTTKVMLWKDTPYTYLKRQSAQHAGHWVSIEMPDQTVVGSVK
ncbi:transglutaminase-like cysteine peptidase [Oricola sp.]|uniref:transglutaminase-like cysteine peptidase n=1 Tax=Oricola sp. TaxID=1979950 RepID=UPI0025FD1058|nr:transglutaminase-like cysteine peptidase [Oricola sp.]MCI5077789.1 transglutaminase-like cysteine peptidase [Oricola sp.]